MKKMLLYYGRQIFGKPVGNPFLLAQTVLVIMLVGLNGDPKFLSKFIPTWKLTSAFLFDKVELTVEANIIVYYGNYISQAFFKNYIQYFLKNLVNRR